ncbi:hypothetical protein SDC9_20129 [bioreactor metagenome]|uniref:Uncharacterized protein n=3 Tax=root TaxID=1 RepID=Q24WB8_DESHY|nr:hypothetical protein HMPREF0322_02895 [Desulfitobacterium hafniense DP7]BAE83674.1 hypothetical protein DSY1885 [Desulfitobacterium hafniense Y51]
MKKSNKFKKESFALSFWLIKTIPAKSMVFIKLIWLQMRVFRQKRFFAASLRYFRANPVPLVESEQTASGFPPIKPEFAVRKYRLEAVLEQTSL